MDNFAFLLPVMFLAFSLTFLIVGRHEGRAAPFWGIGLFCAAAGFITPVLPDVIPAPFRAVAADTCFLLALSFYGEGLLRQFRQTLPVLPRALLVALGIVASVVCTFVLRSPTAAFAANDFVTSLCLSIPAFVVVRHARRLVERVLVGLVFAVIIDTIVRNVVLTLLNRNPQDFENFLASPYAFLMQTTSLIIGVLMALTALACVTLDVIGRYKDVAERDPLTGLFNRRGFERLIQQGPVSGAVVVCDIDHFKRVNDRFGHAAGDMVICRLGRLLAEAQGADVVLARFGGEEFVAFLPGMPLQAARKIASAMHARIAMADWPSVGVNHVTASFGVAASRGDDISLYDIIARADRALYAAKHAGRNRVMADGEGSSSDLQGRSIRSVA